MSLFDRIKNCGAPAVEAPKMSVVRDINFWPKLKVLGTWFSAFEWQGLDDVTWFHENDLGINDLPTIPSTYLSGFVSPFNGIVSNVDLVVVPSHADSSTELALFKFSSTSTSTVSRVGDAVVPGGAKLPFTVDNFIISDANVIKGDILLLCAREHGRVLSSPHFVGNLIIKEV